MDGGAWRGSGGERGDIFASGRRVLIDQVTRSGRSIERVEDSGGAVFERDEGKRRFRREAKPAARRDLYAEVMEPFAALAVDDAGAEDGEVAGEAAGEGFLRKFGDGVGTRGLSLNGRVFVEEGVVGQREDVVDREGTDEDEAGIRGGGDELFHAVGGGGEMDDGAGAGVRGTGLGGKCRNVAGERDDLMAAPHRLRGDLTSNESGGSGEEELHRRSTRGGQW